MPKRKGQTQKTGKDLAAKRQRGKKSSKQTGVSGELSNTPPTQNATGKAPSSPGEQGEIDNSVLEHQNNNVNTEMASTSPGVLVTVPNLVSTQSNTPSSQASVSGGDQTKGNGTSGQTTPNPIQTNAAQTGAALFISGVQPVGIAGGTTLGETGTGPIAINTGLTSQHQLSSVGDPVGANVPQATKEKVWKGEFVPLTSMLVDKQTTHTIPPWSFQQLGSNLVVQQAQPPKKLIKDINSWTNAFIIYMGIYIQKHPQRAQELLKYMQTVRTYANGFSYTTWVEYDREFRARQERNPTRSWAAIDMEAYARMMMHSNPMNQTTWAYRPAQQQFGGRQTFLQRRSSPCFAFNRGECTKGTTCQFNHVCQSCGKAGHTARSCYSQAQRGLQPSCTKCGKQGHTAAVCWSGNTYAQNQRKQPAHAAARPNLTPTPLFPRKNAR